MLSSLLLSFHLQCEACGIPDMNGLAFDAQEGRHMPTLPGVDDLRGCRLGDRLHADPAGQGPAAGWTPSQAQGN